jgi:hypothetical protein
MTYYITSYKENIFIGARGSLVVKALGYKPEGRRFESFFLFNSNNYTIYPSDMDNKYIFCLIYSNGKIYITW